jgi:hypothetical protein
MMKNVFEFYVGRELPLLVQECEKLVEPFIKLKHKWALFSLKAMIHTIHGLIDCNYAEVMALLFQAGRDINVTSTSHSLEFLTGFERLILSYIMCDKKQAPIEACGLRRLDRRPYHEIDTCIFFTLDCLARMDACPSNGIQRRATLVILRKRISILTKFSSVNPQSCLGMLYLVQA